MLISVNEWNKYTQPEKLRICARHLQQVADGLENGIHYKPSTLRKFAEITKNALNNTEETEENAGG